MNAERHRIQFVNNFETRFLAGVVDAGDVDQIIEGKFVPTEFCDLTQIAWRDCIGRFTAKLRFMLDLYAERFLQRGEQFLCGHVIKLDGMVGTTRLAVRGRRSAMSLPISCERLVEFLRELRLLCGKGFLARNF